MPDSYAALLETDIARQASLPDWPMFGLISDVRPFLAKARLTGQPVALVTLIKAEGGGPRRPGAQMAVARDEVAGFLSGGCVEADIVCHARDCLVDGHPRRLAYGEGSPFFDIRLLCGRRIEILVERLMPDDAATRDLLRLSALRRDALWRSDGRVRACREPTETVQDEAGVDAGGQAWKLYRPTLRFMVIGRDPAILAMAMLASQSAFETTIVRIDGPASAPPVPRVAYRRTPLGKDLDCRTAVVVAQHDPDSDHSTVLNALRSNAAYVGLMGARHTIDAHLTRLRDAGVPPDRLAQLKAPVGLPLGSHTPWEIAVSVIGEVMQAFNAKNDK